jgi:hypothetical protein
MTCMKRTFLFLLILQLIILAVCCKNESVKKDYYIISKNDSTLNTRKKEKIPGMEWYYNMVIIFDSTDKVYVYQTKFVETYDPTKKYINLDSVDKYPSYIGLRPEYLLTFKTEYFIDFIRDNNDIFILDTFRPIQKRFINLVSNQDTIKNNAFYDLINLITPKGETRKQLYRVLYRIRTLTEEEFNVLFHKKDNTEYDPENIKWSENFIIGKCSPFTTKYDSIEKMLPFKIKACETYSANFTKLPKIE